MVTAQQLTGASVDGALFGQSSTDKIGFYGLATPIVRPSGASQAAVTKTTTTTSTTTALTVDIDAVRVLANALRLALVNLGMIAGA